MAANDCCKPQACQCCQLLCARLSVVSGAGSRDPSCKADRSRGGRKSCRNFALFYRRFFRSRAVCETNLVAPSHSLRSLTRGRWQAHECSHLSMEWSTSFKATACCPTLLCFAELRWGTRESQAGVPQKEIEGEIQHDSTISGPTAMGNRSNVKRRSRSHLHNALSHSLTQTTRWHIGWIIFGQGGHDVSLALSWLKVVTLVLPVCCMV